MAFIKNKKKNTQKENLTENHKGKKPEFSSLSILHPICYFYHESKQEYGILYSLDIYTLDFIMSGGKYTQSSHGHALS